MSETLNVEPQSVDDKKREKEQKLAERIALCREIGAWLGPEELALILGVSRSSARRMMLDGSIPTVTLRSGRRKKIIRVTYESLQRWLRTREKDVAKRKG